MNLLRCLALVACALLPLPLAALDLPATRAAIDAHIAQPRFAAARWGIAVVSLDSGRTLYAHDADKLFQPASTAKLYTAALVLQGLDVNYRIPTRVLGAPPDRRGRVDGPLVLYGMGDPSLGAAPDTVGWADALAGQLAARGVRRVRGDLIADASYFVGPPIGSGWEAADLTSSFAAPATALSVDENRWRLTIAPAARAGQPAVLAFDPARETLRVENRLLTAPPGQTSDINLYRAPGDDVLQVFGRVAARSPARHFALAMHDPARVAGMQLLHALQRRGIRLDGQLRVHAWPQPEPAWHADAAVLAQVQSPPLAALLREGLKRSQNLYLQNLLQLAGTPARAAALADPGASGGFRSDAARALHALHRLLERIGIAPAASQLDEGTGLSRRDLTTPAALARLLVFLAAGPDAATWREMLPVAGVDGTLAGRMQDTPAAGNVHAKTGSMSQISALAGYVTSAAGEHLAFAILLNGYQPPPGQPASAEVDAIAVHLAELDQKTL